jgi:hypothetical protein
MKLMSFLFVCVFFFSSFAAMQFPFDTSLTGLITDNGRLLADSVFISRYFLKFKFGPVPTSLVCCPKDIAFDFGLSTPKDNKFPQDRSTLLFGGSYDGSICSPPCTDYINIDSSSRTHEYRFSPGDIPGHELYMKVLDGAAPDSIKVRFDTISFLTPVGTTVRPAATHSEKITLGFDNGFVTVYGLANGKLSFFEVSGKRLSSSIFSSKNARIPMPALSGARIFLVRIEAERQEMFLKKCFVN